MKEIREMNEEEVKALNGKLVVELFNDFDKKLNGEARPVYDKPFPIKTSLVGIWYTNNDGLYIHIQERCINTLLDFICDGYSEDEAKMLATNDKVTVTSIYQAAKN